MNVVTMVELDTCQIRYLIDLMWSMNPSMSSQLAVRHGIDDSTLERQLQIALGSALAEI